MKRVLLLVAVLVFLLKVDAVFAQEITSDWTDKSHSISINNFPIQLPSLIEVFFKKDNEKGLRLTIYSYAKVSQNDSNIDVTIPHLDLNWITKKMVGESVCFYKGFGIGMAASFEQWSSGNTKIADLYFNMPIGVEFLVSKALPNMTLSVESNFYMNPRYTYHEYSNSTIDYTTEFYCYASPKIMINCYF